MLTVARSGYAKRAHNRKNYNDNATSDNAPRKTRGRALPSWQYDGMQCPNCNGGEFCINSDCDDVCMGCGMVCGQRPIDTNPSFIPREYSQSLRVGGSSDGRLRRSPRYQRRSHWREKCSQLSGLSPHIPNDLFQLIHTAYFQGDYIYPPPEFACRQHISKVLRSIEIPVDLAEKYSLRRSGNPRTTMVTYSERFTQIKMRLCYELRGKQWTWLPIRIPRQTQLDIESILLQLETPFERYRHTEACVKSTPRLNKCHLKYSCRKFFPDTCFVFGALLRVLRPDDWAYYIQDIPQLKCPRNMRFLDTLVGKMCAYIGMHTFKPMHPVFFTSAS